LWIFSKSAKILELSRFYYFLFFDFGKRKKNMNFARFLKKYFRCCQATRKTYFYAAVIITIGIFYVISRDNQLESVSPQVLTSENSNDDAYFITADPILQPTTPLESSEIENKLLLHDTLRYSLSKFALVVPFVPSQLPRINQDITVLWKLYHPCNITTIPRQDKNSKPDLVFYMNFDSNHSAWENIRVIVNNSEEIRTCFNEVLFLSANLTTSQDRYPGGADYMFWFLTGVFGEEINIIELTSNSTTNYTRRTPYSYIKNYDYIFYKEPDCVPVRSGWLSQLHEQCSEPIQHFWIKGTIYRGGSHNNLQDYTFIPYRFHINGNAFYAIGDPNFVQFVSRVQNWVVNEGHQSNAYDTDFFNYLIQKGHYHEIKHLAHLFQFTNLVSNMWHSEWSSQQMASEGTYLVHGGQNMDNYGIPVEM
jgi:hypothetical protein